MMSRAFQPKVAMPLKSEERMTMFRSLAGTTRIRNALTAHSKMEDAEGRGKVERKDEGRGGQYWKGEDRNSIFISSQC